MPPTTRACSGACLAGAAWDFGPELAARVPGGLELADFGGVRPELLELTEVGWSSPELTEFGCSGGWVAEVCRVPVFRVAEVCERPEVRTEGPSEFRLIPEVVRLLSLLLGSELIALETSKIGKCKVGQ